jgi:peptidyl-prolyl cis-trans isomerase B (cyclophilin B)
VAQRRRLSLIAAPALAVLAAGCGGGNHASTPTVPGCTTAPKPSTTARTAPRPSTPLDPARRYEVSLQTNCGSFTILLAVGTSPHVAASFVDLVKRHYFDRTIFHRIVPGFVIQGGDPTGTGTGGPGYTTVDAPPASTRYTPGVVAMAKAGDERAGTSGSQFFVVTGSDASSLQPDYAVLGRVVRGLSVVRRIGRLGDPATEQPTTLVELEHASVVVR